MAKEIDLDLVQAYIRAVHELAAEGNERAKVVIDLFKGSSERGHIVHPASPIDWASNIHYNVWGENSFGGILKARVVVNRIKEGAK